MNRLGKLENLINIHLGNLVSWTWLSTPLEFDKAAFVAAGDDLNVYALDLSSVVPLGSRLCYCKIEAYSAAGLSCPSDFIEVRSEDYAQNKLKLCVPVDGVLFQLSVHGLFQTSTAKLTYKFSGSKPSLYSLVYITIYAYASTTK
jgi:hypothetical protein